MVMSGKRARYAVLVTAKAASEAWRIMQRLLFDGEGHDRMTEACGITGTPAGVVKTLMHLNPDEPTPMRDIASHFSVDASYITSLVDDLEAHGLAERRPHPTDRRIKTVALTPKGIDIQRQVYELMWKPPTCFGALSGPELRQLRDLLSKLAGADQRLAGMALDEHGPVAPMAT